MKTVTGTVVSTKMTKTVVVKTERPWRHPVYKKTVRRSKKYLVNNLLAEIKEGDRVIIRATRPMSRRKHWEVIKKLS